MRTGTVAHWGGPAGRAAQAAPAAASITASSKTAPTDHTYLFMAPLLTSSPP